MMRLLPGKNRAAEFRHIRYLVTHPLHGVRGFPRKRIRALRGRAGNSFLLHEALIEGSAAWSRHSGYAILNVRIALPNLAMSDAYLRTIEPTLLILLVSRCT
jgi:hypothetical protein